jgi:hypothetical protein
MLKRYGFLLPAVCAVVALAGAASASAEVQCSSCVAWWHLNSASIPASLPPGGEGDISVMAENYGDAGMTSAVTIRDRLPAGVEAQSVVLGPGLTSKVNFAESDGECEVLPKEVTCTLVEPIEYYLNYPYSHIEIYIKVKVKETAKSGEVNEASVSGGGAPGAAVSRPIAVGGGPVPFGVEQYELRAENANGSPDTQAGSHPFQLTTVVALNQAAEVHKPPAAPKDLRFNLPPGLIGNPTPFPQCPLAKFVTEISGGNLCPDDTAVGVASVTVVNPVGEQSEQNLATYTVPVFALAPSVGEPARFGFIVARVPIYLDTSVRTGGDYGVTVTVPNITELTGDISSRVSIWGVPGDPRHDSDRGWNCLQPGGNFSQPCEATKQATPPPLLTMPTACTGPVHTSVEAESWQQEGSFTAPFEYTFENNLGQPVGMVGCNELPFDPSIKVTPDGQAGSTPTGLTVDEHVPQETSLNPTGLAEADVKGLSVTLPEGVVLNPSAADGLQACSEEEIGLQSGEASTCPEASKVATVKIETPLLPNPLEGAAYLAAQDANPFGSLVAMYIEAYDPIAGVRAKATGEVLENPVTGQLTAHFEGDPVFENDPRYASEPAADFLPELPFEDVELHFFGGDRAPLGTPALCGAYTTTGTFTPWSGGATTESSSTFDITSGPNGGPCEDPLPFSPYLTAGPTSIQAGGFTPFTMTMSREDGNQSLQAISLRMPPGLSGLLSSVKLCGEAQADQGTCGPESEIGETTVSVGLGGDPFSVKGGKVFITGPYDGAPFGLSIVNPAKAGPFNLGIVVVRAKIEVDPITSALTVTSDSTGPYKIPTILDGIPLQIKHVNVTINRPGFTFNPSSCEPMSIGAKLTSDEGATSNLSVLMQVTNCAILGFKPSLAVSASSKSSRADGTSVTFKISYPSGAMGKEAWLAKAKFDIPKQLPARLTTLQKACTVAVFNANPAACPPASKIGTAVVHTQLLPVPLEGPVIFVSNGGAKFPEAVLVLSGDNVNVDVHGETFINEKTGVTSATFSTIPGVPFENVTVTLPAGPYSEFTATSDLCNVTSTVSVKKKVRIRSKGHTKTVTRKVKQTVAGTLQMPTEFTGQNGAEVHVNTPITVSGCGKAKTKVKKKGKASRRPASATL